MVAETGDVVDLDKASGNRQNQAGNGHEMGLTVGLEMGNAVLGEV
jgi:hypothetical protein